MTARVRTHLGPTIPLLLWALGGTCRIVARTAPFDSDSGASHGARHIRGGRPRPRKVLYRAGIAARRCNPDMRAFYQRLADHGKPHKVAITAVIPKLVVLANALLRDDRLWQPQVPAKA